jgi:ethanolamine utilization protein EutP (predicted NTPase)
VKLRLILKTKTNKQKEVSIKFNVAPRKHIGFINFINLALNQDIPIELSFEKISKTGEKEESKIFGQSKLQGKDEKGIQDLEKEIQDSERRRKKIQQKKKQK